MSVAIKKNPAVIFAAMMLLYGTDAIAQPEQSVFAWPEKKSFAISLTFDDGRASQVDKGIAVLDEAGIRATFYVLPSAVAGQLEGWKKAVAGGHEIGNHSLKHPCTGNFPWSRENALENYSLEAMRNELLEASRQIEKLLGIRCLEFAYPCGQTFVGRGPEARSYVPVVAELFRTGRVWMSETPNDPAFCDLAQLTGMESDGKEFEDLLPVIEQAKRNGQWLVLAGHDIGEAGPQTTRIAMLKKLIAYARDPVNGVWIAPVGDVANYIRENRN